MNNDWSYSLPNNYAIWHINVRSIVLMCIEQERTTTIIGGYISEFAYNENYVVLKQVDSSFDLTQPLDISNPKYYIINTIEQITEGPFSEDQYCDNIQQIDNKNLSVWIKTYPRPQGAIFSVTETG